MSLPSPQVKWVRHELPERQYVDQGESWDRTRSRQSTAEWATDNLSNPQNKTGGWHTCAEAVKRYDETFVRNWKEEIDTLLVFAGLFSAVVTAFIIDSYKWLQQDSAYLSAQILAEISAKLDSFSLSNGFINSTYPVTTTLSADFHVPAWAVAVNVLWFSSLVSALTSAFIGIVVKQWLREYMRPVATSPIEAATVRQFRYHGLKSWGVIEIISILPLMLEFAVVLFLTGLLELLWTLHPVVAGILTAFVASTLLFYVATTVLPAFSNSNCPYKSPQSWAFRHLIWRILPRKSYKSMRGWQDREMVLLLQGSLKRYTINALLWVEKVFWDSEVLDSIGSCLMELRSGYSDAAVLYVHRVMAYRMDASVDDLRGRLENRDSRRELEVSVDYPPRLRMDSGRGQRLRRILMESLVWQWSISAEHVDTAPVLTKVYEIFATMGTLPESQDCFDVEDELLKKTIEIILDILGKDPSLNELLPQVQGETLEALSYFCYRTPPPTLQAVLPKFITTVRKAYSNASVFLVTGYTLIRVLGRWDITSFQHPETHLAFMELLLDMKKYFDQCNREKIPYADRRVNRWPRRMKAVISRFQLSDEDVNRLNDVLEALKKGEELGLIPNAT